MPKISLYKYCLGCFPLPLSLYLRLLTLGEASCHIVRQPFGEAYESRLGSGPSEAFQQPEE